MIITIEIPANDELRVLTAFGTGEPRTPCTAAELTTTIEGWLSSNTMSYEQETAMKGFRAPPLGLMA